MPGAEHAPNVGVHPFVVCRDRGSGIEKPSVGIIGTLNPSCAPTP